MEEYQKINGLKKIKENDELKGVEVDEPSNFIMDQVESSSNADVYTDDDDDHDDDNDNDDYDFEEDRVIGFR